MTFSLSKLRSSDTLDVPGLSLSVQGSGTLLTSCGPVTATSESVYKALCLLSSAGYRAHMQSVELAHVPHAQLRCSSSQCSRVLKREVQDDQHGRTHCVQQVVACQGAARCRAPGASMLVLSNSALAFQWRTSGCW